MGIKNCVVCGDRFDEDFPKNFPDKFKMCCNCCNSAEVMCYSSDDGESVIKLHKDLLQEADKIEDPFHKKDSKVWLGKKMDRLLNVRKLVTIYG